LNFLDNRFWKKVSNIKFNEYPFSWSPVDQCGRTDSQTDGRDEATNNIGNQLDATITVY